MTEIIIKNDTVIPPKMPASYIVLAIDIVRQVNRIPLATLTLIDGDVAKREFLISDSGFFDLGQVIEVYLRPKGENQDVLVFRGLVMSHAWEANTNQSILTIVLKDSAIKMTQSRKSRVSLNTTDQSVINNIINSYKLEVGQPEFPVKPSNDIVQYNCTDWDFILTRAEANGLLVNVVNGSISFNTIDLEARVSPSLKRRSTNLEARVSPSLKRRSSLPLPRSQDSTTINYVIDVVYSIEIEANANGQYDEVSSTGWDIPNQKMTVPQKPSIANLIVSPGDIKSADLAAALQNKHHALTSPAPLKPAELQSWCDGTLARSRLALIRGRICVPGRTNINLLDTIVITGVGKHFGGANGGRAMVTGLRHRVTEELGWVTDLQFGLAEDWFANRPDIAPPPAAGLTPPVSGLQIGVVDTFEEDKYGPYRVKVKIPALAGQPQEGQQPQVSVWARLASPDAGNKRGFYVRPEAGDEVVLGFFNEDPRQPVIIGSLYSSGINPIPAENIVGTPNAENDKKGWVSKTGMSIVFDDKNEKISIVTLNNTNSIVLDGKNKTIVISDINENSISMSSEGISIDSKNKISIMSKENNVNINGKNFKND